MAGTSWPDLVAGRTAKASEVEAKFDWLEGHLVPMNSGATTDVAYDLGTESARWRRAYFTSINPTSTAGGVAIGTTTADAGALLDLAGTKALMLPRLSTAQRDALTGKDGMLIFNSTTGQYQLYKTTLAAWSNIGGTVFRTQPRAETSTTAANTTTVLSIPSGGGRLDALRFNCVSINPTFSVVIDGVQVWNGSGLATAASYAVGPVGDMITGVNIATATVSFAGATSTAQVLSGKLGWDFATSCAVHVYSPTASDIRSFVMYSLIV